MRSVICPTTRTRPTCCFKSSVAATKQRSIVVTTNLLFMQWDTVFPNASCAVALIDRLTHHAEIIPTEGESYRKREAELAQKKRRAAT
jgi:DNA replication protein DnaC